MLPWETKKKREEGRKGQSDFFLPEKGREERGICAAAGAAISGI